MFIIQFTIFFKIEMVIIPGFRIEVGARGIDNDFTQHSAFRELVQSVVNDCQRDPEFFRLSFQMQDFRRYIAILSVKQQLGQGQTGGSGEARQI